MEWVKWFIRFLVLFLVSPLLVVALLIDTVYWAFDYRQDGVTTMNMLREVLAFPNP